MKKGKRKSKKGDWQGALTLANEILANIEELPEAAEDFGASIQEKIESMAEWIETNERVTPKMISALSNMHAGVEKWMD